MVIPALCWIGLQLAMSGIAASAPDAKASELQALAADLGLERIVLCAAMQPGGDTENPGELANCWWCVAHGHALAPDAAVSLQRFQMPLAFDAHRPVHRAAPRLKWRSAHRNRAPPA